MMNEGCGCSRWKVASKSPLVVTSFRVPVELLLPVLAGQRMPRALHVLGRERLAVMPLDALPQFEGQFGVACVPGPALPQLGHDALEAVEWLGLIEQHEIVEHRHERLRDGDGGLLVQRSAWRVVAMVDPERTALFLGIGSRGGH
jgi:hypothetical protein